MSNCNRNCFDCPYDDCIQDEMTTEEKDEINRRDEVADEQRKILGIKLEIKYGKKVSQKDRCHQYYLEHREEIRQKQKEYRERKKQGG